MNKSQKIIYVKEKKPIKDSFSRKIHQRAPEITFDCAQKSWQGKNTEMNRLIKRGQAQVIVITAHHDDVTHVAYKSLKKKPLGKYEIATTVEQEFPDGELKILLENESPKAQSVYIISSILNERDFSRARKVADHYKNTLNAKFVTLVCPYLGYTREDKNITPKGEYEPSVTSIRSEISACSPVIDRMIVIEPHSSATQAYAAGCNIPLAPISPWKLLIEELIKKKKIDPGNTVVIRPDKGRNFASSKIGRFLKIPYVSFKKVRVSGQAVSLFELSEEEKKLIKGKNGIIYDDEASTMGTMYAIAEALLGYGAKSLFVCLVHCKFTFGWENRIKHPLFNLVLGTDSRQPIGNINIADNIEIVSIEPLIRQVIEADIRGVNFWADREFREMILQEE